MKICLFADATSVHSIRWCTHFHELGHEVHLISFKTNDIPSVQVHVVDAGPISVRGGNWKVLLSFRKVKKLLKQIQPEIFHSLYATSYGITGALCGFHPYVITALGTDVLISPQQSKIYKYLLKYAFSKADWITAMADHMNEAIQKMGVPSSKISTVPFGIDPAVFKNTSEVLDKNRFVITSTRNFEKVYNIPHLIKALARVKRQIPNLHLNLIGAGSLQNELEILIEELGLKEDVTFFGKIPQSEISKVLNRSHLFVTVSLSDGNNISLNEAMACGTLSIATNIPANTQWISDGENGFLVSIDDVDGLAEKIVYSYQNFETLKANAFSINQKIIAEKGIWSNNMKTVEDKYKSLILKK